MHVEYHQLPWQSDWPHLSSLCWFKNWTALRYPPWSAIFIKYDICALDIPLTKRFLQSLPWTWPWQIVHNYLKKTQHCWIPSNAGQSSALAIRICVPWPLRQAINSVQIAIYFLCYPLICTDGFTVIFALSDLLIYTWLSARLSVSEHGLWN